MTHATSTIAVLAITLTLAIAACAAPPSPDADGARGEEAGTAASEPADPGATPMTTEPPCYRLTELSPDQVQIDCTDGQAFVVRRNADGRWTEERKAHAGVPTPSWERAEDAAAERCGCGG